MIRGNPALMLLDGTLAYLSLLVGVGACSSGLSGLVWSAFVEAGMDGFGKVGGSPLWKPSVEAPFVEAVFGKCIGASTVLFPQKVSSSVFGTKVFFWRS